MFTRELGKILSPEHFGIFAIVDFFFVFLIILAIFSLVLMYLSRSTISCQLVSFRCSRFFKTVFPFAFDSFCIRNSLFFVSYV